MAMWCSVMLCQWYVSLRCVRIPFTPHSYMDMLCSLHVDVQASDAPYYGYVEPSNVGGHSRQVEGGREGFVHNAHK